MKTLHVQYDISTTGDHVSLVINQVNLPDDDHQRDALLEELETAVKTVLANSELSADRIKTVSGHTYTSIGSDCPQCGDQLKLIEPTLDDRNGAFATASCTCGWRGDAIYRLIDLHEAQSESQPTGYDSLTDSESSTASLEETSSVRLNDIQPDYTPY
jgi:hypothetical protein